MAVVTSVAPFREGYLALTIGDGELTLLYGEVETADVVPTFSSLDYLPVSGGPAQSSILPGQVAGVNAFVFALDDSTTVVVAVCWPDAGDLNSLALCATAFYDTGMALQQVSDFQTLVPIPLSDVESGFQWAAATIPGQPGVLLASGVAGSALSFAWCYPPANYAAGQPLELSVDTPTGVGAELVGNLSFTVGINNANTSPAPYIAVASMYAGTTCAFSGWELSITDDAVVLTSLPAFTYTSSDRPRPALTSSDEPWAGFSLFTGPDGLTYYQWPAALDYDVGLFSFLSLLQVMQHLTTLGISGATGAMPVYFTFGDLSQTPAPGDPAEVVPVYWTFLNDVGKGHLAQLGYAERVAWSPTPPSDPPEFAIGILDSGPPFPNGNLGEAPGSVGTTVFGATETQTTGWQMGVSVGGFLQVETTSGIPEIFALKSQFKVTFGVTGTFSRQTQQVEVQLSSIDADAIVQAGTAVIKPLGGVLLSGTAFIGYRYRYLDMQKQPTSAPYYEVYPTQWTFRQLPFDYAETTPGVFPGDLLSYQLDGEALQQLEGQLLNSSCIASVAWAEGSSFSDATMSITSGSESVGASLSVEASIGATFGPDGDSVSVTAGVTASTSFTYSWATSSQNQITSSLAKYALPEPPPAGAFSSYSYDVLLLRHDPAYAQALIALLEANPTANNAAVLAHMAPTSAPWRIAHVVTDYVPALPSFVSYDGNVYAIAGAAPLYVSNWESVGGEQPAAPYDETLWEALAAYPLDGTFVQVSSGEVYRFAGGAPLYVSSWASVGIQPPAVSLVTVDSYVLATIGAAEPLGHVLQYPRDGTLIQGFASGDVYEVTGGHPALVGDWSSGNGNTPTIVDDAVIAHAGGTGVWGNLA